MSGKEQLGNAERRYFAARLTTSMYGEGEAVSGPTVLELMRHRVLEAGSSREEFAETRDLLQDPSHPLRIDNGVGPVIVYKSEGSDRMEALPVDQLLLTGEEWAVRLVCEHIERVREEFGLFESTTSALESLGVALRSGPEGDLLSRCHTLYENLQNDMYWNSVGVRVLQSIGDGQVVGKFVDALLEVDLFSADLPNLCVDLNEGNAPLHPHFTHREYWQLSERESARGPWEELQVLLSEVSAKEKSSKERVAQIIERCDQFVLPLDGGEFTEFQWSLKVRQLIANYYIHRIDSKVGIADGGRAVDIIWHMAELIVSVVGIEEIRPECHLLRRIQFSTSRAIEAADLLRQVPVETFGRLQITAISNPWFLEIAANMSEACLREVNSSLEKNIRIKWTNALADSLLPPVGSKEVTVTKAIDFLRTIEGGKELKLADGIGEVRAWVDSALEGVGLFRAAVADYWDHAEHLRLIFPRAIRSRLPLDAKYIETAWEVINDEKWWKRLGECVDKSDKTLNSVFALLDVLIKGLTALELGERGLVIAAQIQVLKSLDADSDARKHLETVILISILQVDLPSAFYQLKDVVGPIGLGGFRQNLEVLSKRAEKFDHLVKGKLRAFIGALYAVRD